MNSDQKSRKKRQAKPSNRQGNKKGKWMNSKNQKYNKSCKRCGRNHDVKDYPWATGACFHCGEKGHMVANCPRKAPQKQLEGQRKRGEGQSQPPRTQGRVYNMTKEEAGNASYVIRGSDGNPLY